MAIIPGVTVEWTLSPRIIRIPTSETSVTVEDLQDTLLDLEWDEIGMAFNHLREFSGGEDLGGGTSVGFTMELQNAILGWNTNVVELETGTVTTPDTTGRTLTDSTATFSTNGVVPGDMVHNSTDGSHATVLDVVSETELYVDGLTGGTDDQFDSADAYTVFDWVLRNITGGNLVAVDDVASSIDPIWPSFGNTVTKTSSSSATIQELQDIQFAAYGGGVTVDVANSTGLAVSGTTYPTGTGRQPSDNLTDALSIANTLGLFKFFIIGDVTLPTGPDFSDKQFEGESENRSTITVPSAATANDCEYRSATITGTLDGNSLIENALVSTLNFVNGTMLNSGLKEATITLGGGVQASIINCYSQVAGNGTPTLSMGGSGQTMILRNYAGGIKIIDKSGTDEVSIDMNSGRVFLEASITDGEIIVRGVGKLIDNTTGTATVTNELVDGEKFQELYTYITTKLLTVAKFIGLK